LISHLGRPLQSQNNKSGFNFKEKYSLKPVYEELRLKIKDLKFIQTSILEKDIYKEIEKVEPGQVVLLENIRFYPREEKNCSRFAKRIASLGDIYVNEAFGVSHRQHSSLAAITKYLPSYAGFLMEKEINELNDVFQKPKHPLVVLMGGKKIITKIEPIKNLLKTADYVLIGGALASNFFKAAGYKIGMSFYEPKMIKKTLSLLGKKNIILPCDLIIKQKNKVKEINVGELNDLGNDFEILDIGKKTRKEFEKYLKPAKMIIWNGPMGYFEDKRFAQGTKSIVQAIFNNNKAKVIIGGGETIMALTKLTDYPIIRLPNLFVSSGGGAMLEFLSGKTLSGINPLIKNK